MDLYTFICAGLDGKLKCFLCKNYLSYFPISVSSNNQSICGRCEAPEGITSYQDEAFETICKFLKFPCRYKSEGCLEELLPEEVPQHEKTCPFRVVACILSNPNPCMWSGSLPTLLSHCQNEHSDILLKKGEFEIDLLCPDKRDYLIEEENRLFIFTKKFDYETKTLRCAVYSNKYELVESRTCQVNFICGSTTLTHAFHTSTYEETTFIEVCLLSLTNGNCKDRKSIQGKIILGQVDSTDQKYHKGNLNSDIISSLKCSKCSNFTMPPLYRCRGTALNIICNSCRNSTSVYYDEVLDIIANSLLYPCKFVKNGCCYTSHWTGVESHVRVCDYQNVKCPFNSYNFCEWEGPRRDTSSHVLAEHQNLLLNVKTEQEFEDETNYQVIHFNNRLFRLVYCMTPDAYMWSLQEITPSKKRCKYEIEVIDRASGGQRISMRKWCAPMTTECDIFKDTHTYCYLKDDQVECLLEKKLHPLLSFKVYIYN